MDGASQRFDVAVVGGGPAGSSAAYILARRGLLTVVLEKSAIPRYKTCGGGVAGRAVHALPFALDGTVQHACSDVRLNFLDEEIHFVAHRGEPVIHMVMRDDFDAMLLSLAREAGAELIAGCSVGDVRQGVEDVTLSTDQGEIRCGFVIAADGVTSLIARKSGWQDGLPVIPALEYEVYASPEVMREYDHTARFDFGVVPSGYAWVFPKKDHLSVGALTVNPDDCNLNESMTSYLSMIGISHSDHRERHGYMIPAGLRKEGFSRRRILLAGDAAGLVDPVTFEGISFAIRSGQLAAQALIETRLDPDQAASRYDRLLATSILTELRIAQRLSTLLYRSNIRPWLFRHYGQLLVEAMTAVMTGEKTYRELLFNPANYAKAILGLGIRGSYPVRG